MRRAVDIALVPRRADRELLVRLNRLLLEAGDDEIRLAGEEAPLHGLPHLSLHMGVVDDASLPRSKTTLEKIAASLAAFELPVHRLHTRARASGGQTTSLAFRRGEALVRLEAEVARRLGPLLTRDATVEDLVENDDPRGDPATALAWIRGYADAASGDRFDPHLTLGHGGPIAAPAPESIHLDELGIYHLGPGCTCRRRLAAWPLTPREETEA